MSAPDPSSADWGLSRTLEDQLHRTRDQLCLVADLVDVQAVTPEAPSDGLSAAACAALREVYRQNPPRWRSNRLDIYLSPACLVRRVGDPLGAGRPSHGWPPGSPRPCSDGWLRS